MLVNAFVALKGATLAVVRSIKVVSAEHLLNVLDLILVAAGKSAVVSDEQLSNA